MKKKGDNDFLDLCLSMLEKKLRQTRLRDLSGSSFEQLSQDIYDQTGIKLSGRTLRRLANKRIINPQVATKNAIAQFIGYRNWSDFVTKNSESDEDFEVFLNQRKTGVFSRFFVLRYFWIIVTVLLIMILLVIINFYPAIETGLNKGRVVFQSNDVTGTAPHTASFFYDVSKVKSSNVFIDSDYYGAGELIPIKKNRHFFDYTFDYPGYYAVKIIANGEKLSCVGVHVQSIGWETIINGTLYKEINNVENGCLTFSGSEFDSITGDSFEAMNVDFRRIQDFDVMGDEMILKTRFKSDCLREDNCNSVRIELINVHGRLSFNFTNPECQQIPVRAEFGDVSMSDQFNNLNTFRQDISYWRNLTITTGKKRVNVYFDDVQIYSIRYNDPLDQMKGLSFGFNGPGSIDFVRIFNEDSILVFSDEFDK